MKKSIDVWLNYYALAAVIAMPGKTAEQKDSAAKRASKLFSGHDNRSLSSEVRHTSAHRLRTYSDMDGYVSGGC